MSEILETTDSGAPVEFHLTGDRAGKSVVLGKRYRFVKGVFKSTEKDAPKLAKILVPYYGCKIVTAGSKVEEPKAEEPKRPAPSK